MKRIPWKWVLILLGISLPIFLVWMYLFWDGPPPEDGDLAFRVKSVRPEENGWLHLKAGFEDGEGVECWPWLPKEKDQEETVERAYELSRGKAWDPDLARKILQRNERGLRLLDESLRYSGFQPPIVEPPYPIDQRCLTLQFLAGAMAVKAFGFEKEKKLEQAFEEVMKVIRLGRKLRGSPRSGFGFLLAISVEILGLEVFELLLRRNPSVSCVRLGFSKELLSEAAGPEIIENFVRSEYALMLRWIAKAEAGEEEFTLGDPFDTEALPPDLWRARILHLPNSTRRTIADATRVLIGNASRLVKDWTTVERPAAVRTGLSGVARLVPIRNGIGKYFVARWIGSEEMAAKRAVLLRLNALFTATHIALECYRETHGRLPARLDDLVPRYLDAVPVDPYDGEPLRYSAEKGIVYSVGEDFKDSGGSVGAGGAVGAVGDGRDGWDGRNNSNEPTLRLGK